MFFSSEKPKPAAVILQGPRVQLRPPKFSDWAQWAKVRGENQDFLRPLEPEWRVGCLTKGFFKKRIERQAQDWRDDRFYNFLIFEQGALIGGININDVCRGAAQFASLGYWLAEDRQGKGFMAEALRLVTGFAFSDLKLHRLNAGCLKHNQRSINLLLRGGFRQEGFAEKYMNICGQWQDHVLFGLNVEDWQNQA